MPRTLAMIKMEKNFVAHIEKGYPRKPYLHYGLLPLCQRLSEEVAELHGAIITDDYEQGKRECADVSNIIDYIFEVLNQKDLQKKVVVK